jgi:hypothetical protein
MVQDDNALMSRFKDGDAAAFDSLYARHKGPLYRYFLRQARPDAVLDIAYPQATLRMSEEPDARAERAGDAAGATLTARCSSRERATPGTWLTCIIGLPDR